MSTFVKGAGSLLGGDMSQATDDMGFTDHEGERYNRDLAAKQEQKSTDLIQSSLDTQVEKYNEWKTIYGDLQEDVSTYFKNLTGDSLATKQIQQVQQAYQASQKQMDEQLAQRGLSGSGAAVQGLIQNSQTMASASANIRANSELEANKQKMGFLNTGLSQDISLTQGIAQTGISGANIQGTLAGGSSSNATSLTNTGLSNTTSKSEEMGQSISSMFGSDKRLKKNLRLLSTIKGINLYSWDWNQIGNSIGYFGSSQGVIAQEVKEIDENFVSVIDGYYAVDYTKVFNYIKDSE